MSAQARGKHAPHACTFGSAPASRGECVAGGVRENEGSRRGGSQNGDRLGLG